MDELIKINEVASLLNVSVATVRNWIKNGSIKIIDGSFFKKDEILKLKNDLESGENARLKSRRNKSKIKGNKLSKKYIESKNGFVIASDILNSISVELNKEEAKIILAEYCLKLYSNKIKKSYDVCLENLENFDSNSPVIKIVYDMISDCSDIKGFIKENRNSLTFNPEYESDDFIGLLWMGLKSLNDRKSGGVYFTPTSIVNKMVSNIKNHNNETVIDPCCGSGNFLLACLKAGFSSENIYGIDVDEISVFLARFNIALNSPDADYTKIVSNIVCRSSLDYTDKKFDICIGNPPWGSDIDCSDLYLRMNYECLKAESVDAFDLFLEKGIKLLNPNGILYFVVPEALLTVGIHSDIRYFLHNNSKLSSIIYWGNAFDGVQAPAISIMFKCGKTSEFEIGASITTSNKCFTINKIRHLNSGIWSLNINDEEFDLLTKVKSEDGIKYLANNSDFALGIVTGDNEKYVLNSKTKEASELVKGSDVYKYKLVKGNYYIEFKPELFQQVAKREYYFAKEKLLYRFISDTLVFAYDDRQTLSLNSANILIPKIDGYSAKYILAILNSTFAHFYFKLVFNSIKILRNHIESIPIPFATVKDQNEIIKLVEKIEIENDKNKIDELYQQIDLKIFDLYHFSKNDIDIIMKMKPQNSFLY